MKSIITKKLSMDCSSIIDINRLIDIDCHRLIFRSSVSSIVQVLCNIVEMKHKWRSLSFFDVYRQVIDLNWKIAHGVLLTAQRLVRFGLSVPLSCFCGSPVESLEHLFFFCPLAQSVLSWLQSLMFNFSHMCPVLLCHHTLFGFSSDELRVTPRNGQDSCQVQSPCNKRTSNKLYKLCRSVK